MLRGETHIGGTFVSVSRSVVLKPTQRCERCQQVLRWCVCSGFQAVECPLRVDVLMHPREFRRPSSTGHLINRVIPSSHNHLFSHETPLVREAVVQPDRVLWILHPAGGPPPVDVPPSSLQVLLLDGSWREAARMRKVVVAWGRLVSLPSAQASRFRLRNQHDDTNYSTVEALDILLGTLGLHEAAARLRAQFELHVYAALRSRGAIGEAAMFLAGSSLMETLPGPLRELQEQRPCPAGSAGARLP